MPAVNDSKGCGAVMRSAPFALMGLSDPGALAAESAALTHGHPSSSVASGALAVMVDALIDGRSLRTAVTAGRDWAERQEQPQEVCRSLDAAVRAADTHELPARVLPTLGEGWIAEEALAIAVFSALRHPEPSMVRDALSLAVTHSGDSDSTGAICGNLVGAAHGADALPGDLVADVEGREAIVQLATDLWIAAEAPERLTVAVAGVEVILDEGWVARYPGW